MLSNRGPIRGVVSCRFATAFSFLCSLTLAAFLAPPSYAQTRDLVVAPVRPGSRITLSGHHPAWASVQNDLGPVPGDLPIEQLALVLARTPRQQQAFERFLTAQQDPSSPDYHHWLTPVEMGERFGATQTDIDAIANWLQSQNLRMDSVASSRIRIQFSGSASAIANAFGSEMHYFQVDGEHLLSIAAEPQIPAALAGIIKSIHGLYSINIQPAHGSGTVQVPARAVDRGSGPVIMPDLTTSTGRHFVVPSDFATIYDLSVGNITGTGQTIAIIGLSRVNDADITNFQTLSGLAPNPPFVIVPPSGTDPGPPETSPPTSGTPSKSQLEATLDVTRAASVAPGATIDLVVSANSISIPAAHVVDSMPVFAQIMSLSFGACESLAGKAGVDFWDSIFSQAAAEGISVFVSSGDAGAAGCDKFFTTPPATQTLSPSYICASSFATCVGGTEFADSDAPASYWSPTDGVNFESALGYIPEGGWNEPVNSKTNLPQIASSGGGVSAFIPTPSWQIGTGLPGTQGRYTPDVAFSASLHDGYFGCFAAAGASCVVQNGKFSFEFFAGTSAAAPDMAGIAALLDQKYGAQGNLNPRLYGLAATPSNNVFHDVTAASSGISNCSVSVPSMCNNSTPGPASQTGGLSGYLVGAGYDEVTGLGSIDVANLLANWAASGTTTSVTSSLNPSGNGDAVTFTATVASNSSARPTGTVAFLDGGATIGSGTLTSAATATVTTSSLSIASHSITAQFIGNVNFTSSTSSALTQVVNLDSTTTTLIPPLLKAPIGGQSLTYMVTVTSSSGAVPTGTITLLDNGTSIGTGPLDAAGKATITTASLAVGSHSIAAHYGGGATFAASASTAATLTLDVAGFGVSPPPSSLNVTAGQSLVIPLTMYAVSGSTLNFQLGCTGLPAKTTCAFSPNPVMPGGLPNGTPIQLTFGTSSSQLPASPSNRTPLPWEKFAFFVGSAALLAAGLLQWRRTPRRRLAFSVCIGVFALAVMIAGCGGPTSYPAPTYTGTPKGLASFTVTGASGSATISVPVAVNIQ